MAKPYYSFIKFFTDLGVGTRDLGFRRTTTIPPTVPYLGNTGRRKWNIERSIGGPSQTGFMILNQQLVPVPLTGMAGLGVAGQLIGGSLVEGKGLNT